MTLQLRIYRQTNTAMQSGRANEARWVVEFEPEGGCAVEVSPHEGPSGDEPRRGIAASNRPAVAH